MIFHENCLLADNSREISYLIFFRKFGKISQNVSSATVVICTLRVNLCIFVVRDLGFLTFDCNCIQFFVKYALAHVIQYDIFLCRRSQ